MIETVEVLPARLGLIEKYREAKSAYDRAGEGLDRKLMAFTHSALFTATADIGYFNRLNAEQRITLTDVALPTL